MNLSFDPRDREACSTALAVIFMVHGDLPEFDAGPVPAAADAQANADAAAAFGSVTTADIAAAHAEPAAAVPAPPVPAPPVAAHAEPAAAVPAPPVPTPPPGVELDTNGLPWDARIHSGKATKKLKNKGGDWRRRRGVSDEEVAVVEAELRHALAAPAVDPTPAAPVADTTASGGTNGEPAADPTPAPTAPVPTPPVADMGTGADAAPTVPSPPPPPEAAPSFADVMRRITQLQTSGALSVAGVQEIAASLELTSVRDLVTRPDLVPAFAALLPDAA